MAYEQDQQVVVITGASSGIGRATARTFARKGYNVVLAARREDALEDVKRECERMGVQALTHQFDVSQQEEVEALAQIAVTTFGHIDVWVNNAAVAMMGPFMDQPVDDIRRLIDINVMGYLYGARAVLPIFREQGHGNLINVSSIVGITGQPFSVAYSTSKFAIRGMSLSLRQELIDEEDIHVCTVLPASVDTPLFENAANYMGREVKAMEPVVDAQEVADEILALARDPKPEVIVGGMGIQNTLMKYLSPDLFAKAYQEQVQKNHFQEEFEPPKKGNLYHPSPARARVSGGWANGRSRAMKTRNRNLMWMGAAVAGAVAGTAAYLMKGSQGKEISDRDGSSGLAHAGVVTTAEPEKPVIPIGSTRPNDPGTL